MQTKRIATIMAVVATLILLLAVNYVVAGPPVEKGKLNALAPVGTAFTYQGRLTDGGNPANGSYDLQFELYDAASDGTLIGTVTGENVTVADGLFTVELDFGAGAFTGDARWLEIGVRPGDSSGAYTTLSPRQGLTAAPYALYAQRVAEHNHLGQTWTGSDNSLVINGAFGAPDYAPLVLSNSNSNGLGLRVDSAGGTGVVVGSAGSAGVFVDIVGNPSGASTSSTKDGFGVSGAEGNGLSIGRADADGMHVTSVGDDGVYVGRTGNPSTTSASASHNGFEVAGAEGNGLYVGRADEDGVYVNSAAYDLAVNTVGYDGVSVGSASDDGVQVISAGDDGVYVGSVGDPSAVSLSGDHNGFEVAGAEGNGLYVGHAGDDGVHVNSAGQDGVYVDSALFSGVFVASAGGNGVSVLSAGGDGVFVHRAGNPSTTSPSYLHNGFEVDGAEGYGLYVGRADVDGVHVHSVGDPSAVSFSDKHNGFDVAGAEGHGLYVGRADQDGVHVDSAGGYAGYFDGDVHVTGAATGFFPRPRWNSGWVTISRAEVKILTHDVGGDPDDYFVDMQCRSSTWGITNTGVGGDVQSVTVEYGATYSALTSSSVKVYRRGDDDHCSQVRIRIWRIN